MWIEWGEVGREGWLVGGVWMSLMNPLAFPFLRMWPRLTHHDLQQQSATEYGPQSGREGMKMTSNADSIIQMLVKRRTKQKKRKTVNNIRSQHSECVCFGGGHRM